MGCYEGFWGAHRTKFLRPIDAAVHCLVYMPHPCVHCEWLRCRELPGAGCDLDTRKTAGRAAADSGRWHA